MKIKKKYLLLLFLFAFCGLNLFSQQNDSVNANGYNVFHFPNGKISSEGTMRNGKPDGYWKNYYENGILKSEGNRKNYLLDSTWRFYDEDGKLVLEINYKKGKKNGFRITYQGDEITKENFVDDVKQGYSYVLYPNGKVHFKIPFVDGLENGQAVEYAPDGRIVQLIQYKKGYVISRQKINRFDSDSLPNGKWIWFYDDEKVHITGNYKHGLKNGYFKTYDRNGNLISTEKYVNGEKETKAENINSLEVKTDYYPNGKVKVVATYTKDGIPEGVRREYDENGKIVKSYIFKHGKIIGEGIFSEAGQKEGFWKEFYDDGKLKASGFYNKDLRVGKWNFYYPDGKLEETGKYIDGDPDSVWIWYYNDGSLLRKENYYKGQLDGKFVEYNRNGKIITQGEYIEGKKEGLWITYTGKFKKEENFADGLLNGWVKIYYPDGTLKFEGKFIDDLPNGEHKWFWPNGKLKQIGRYVMGKKTGDWKKFDENGNPIITITYKNGKELKYDGVKVD